MAIIGNFKYLSKTKGYMGDITTLTFHRAQVEFRPTEKKGEKGPDYRVLTKTEFGNVELGAAWKRTSEKGTEFLSVSIDDPALTASVNAQLFDGVDDEASLVWNRPKAKEKSKEKVETD